MYKYYRMNGVINKQVVLKLGDRRAHRDTNGGQRSKENYDIFMVLMFHFKNHLIIFSSARLHRNFLVARMQIRTYNKKKKNYVRFTRM